MTDRRAATTVELILVSRLVCSLWPSRA